MGRKKKISDQEREEARNTGKAVTATGGTFTLTLDNHTTSAIAFNATAETIQAAIAALALEAKQNAE